MKLIQRDLDQTGLAILRLDNSPYEIAVPLYDQNIAKEVSEYYSVYTNEGKPPRVEYLLETLNYKKLNRTLVMLRHYKNEGILSEEHMEELRNGFGSVETFLPSALHTYMYA